MGTGEEFMPNAMLRLLAIACDRMRSQRTQIGKLMGSIRKRSHAIASNRNSQSKVTFAFACYRLPSHAKCCYSSQFLGFAHKIPSYDTHPDTTDTLRLGCHYPAGGETARRPELEPVRRASGQIIVAECQPRRANMCEMEGEESR